MAARGIVEDVEYVDLHEYITECSPDPYTEGGISIGILGTGQSGKTSLLRQILQALDERTPGHGIMLMTNSPYSKSIIPIKKEHPNMAVYPTGYDKDAVNSIIKRAASTAKESRMESEGGDGELEDFYTLILDDTLKGGKGSGPCINAAMAGRNHGITYIQTAHHFKHIDTGIRDHMNYLIILRMCGSEGVKEVLNTVLKRYLQASKLYTYKGMEEFFEKAVEPSKDKSIKGGFFISQLDEQAFYMEYSLTEATLYPLLERYEEYIEETWRVHNY